METVHMIVADLDVQPVARITPLASISQAAVALAETGGTTLVVDTAPFDEVTERDVVLALANDATGETPLSELTRGVPLFVHPSTTVAEVATIMMTSGRNALVVLDEGEPTGVIELTSVIAALWGATSWWGALRVALRLERNDDEIRSFAT
jgi:CBS domain-containing protein